MKKFLYAALTFAALAAMIFVPQLGSAAASAQPAGIVTTLPPVTATVIPPIVILPPQPVVGPLTITLSPLAGSSFKANILVGGRQPLFGLSVLSLKATLNGKSVPVFMDNFGFISFQHVILVDNVVSVSSTYCVSLTIQYGQGGIAPQTASAHSCLGISPAQPVSGGTK
jgi:hypothetical protein